MEVNFGTKIETDNERHHLNYYLTEVFQMRYSQAWGQEKNSDRFP